MNDQSIPIIDFEGFGDGSTPKAKQIASRFVAACRDVGFAYLTNHGIPESQIDSMFDASRKFFKLPEETKMLAPETGSFRGFSGIGLERVSQMVYDQDELKELREKVVEQKEHFIIGSETNDKLKNVWIPEDNFPGFKAQTLAFKDSCRALELKVMSAIAIGLKEIPSDYFDQYHSHEESVLRLQHYPSAPWKDFDDGKKVGISAHTDYCTCTLLLQDTVGGLEVEDKHHPGSFVPVPPIPGTIVFNVADALQRWTNDELVSPLHRVKAPAQRVDSDKMTPERYSIPYFCIANMEAVVDAIPGTWSNDKPKKYDAITAGEYLIKRLTASYT